MYFRKYQPKDECVYVRCGRRRIIQAELEMILAAHERFVTGKPGGKRANLRFINFTGLDL